MRTACRSESLATSDDLHALFEPRAVAVIGASRHGTKLGAVMARSLAGFPGGCLLVNSRNPDPAAGVYPSLREAVAETGQTVDLVVLCVPAAASAAVLADASDAGARAAVACAGGFSEIGDGGAAHERALADVVASTGVRLLGPNTSGFVAPAHGLTASFVPAAAEVPSGSVGVVAASGGVNHALAFALANAGTGVSVAAGIGTGIDVTAADVVEYLATDPATTAIALHVETVPDGPRLLAAVRAASAVKPVVALVVGRSDVADFARSHTGALATSWRTTRAALRQAGAVIVDDDRELVDAVTALTHTRLEPSADPGVGLVTAQAGPGLLLADRLRADGVRLPELAESTRARIAEVLPPLTYQRNPVDTGRPDGSLATVLRAVADDPAIDVVASYTLSEPDTLDLTSVAQDAGLPGDVPAVLTIGGLVDETDAVRAQLHKIGVPALTNPAAAANAVRALVADARACHRAAAPTRSPAMVPSVPEGPLDEARAKAYLATLGVRTPESRVCTSLTQACAALTDIGGPVAVKLLDATVTHKTEVGGVHLGIRTEPELADAVRALARTGAPRYLVEAMAPPGFELVVGARRDPVFGPVVLVGLGGTTAEALADVAIRVAPVSHAEAAAMPGDLAGSALLDGWRGGPVLDRDAFADVVTTLGDALVAYPELDEIEINPLRVTDAGLLALDAVITRTQEGT
ncbi:acetate--CoA ligase family protein [Haloechinothrix salitolerans]|uniref:Acetate--CoA ligase family protein n=1 Tax=Haloechinothrix salitolerans TaxID=926830 RepID=A0ABW2C3G0_9PSEU